MKRTHLIAFLILTMASSLGATTFEADMQAALDIHEKAQSIPVEVEALDRFKSLVTSYPDEWLPSFWAAYMCTQIARLDGRVDNFPENLDGPQLLRDAQSFLDKAKQRKTDKSPKVESDVHMLQGFIYFMTSFFTTTEMDKGKLLQSKEAEYQEAIRLNPRNPLMYVVSAISMVRNEEASYDELMMAIALFDWAEQAFAAAPQRSLTTHWNEEMIPFWRPLAEKRLAEMLANPS